MTAHLLIRDSSPQWWLSSDIWVVPGSDPNGPPGAPIAGQPAYLWARVSNIGDTPASGTRIDFYWANPSAQVAVGVATQIGSAFVDLAAGDTQDVLCLVTWSPSIVNGGHECVLAVAHGQNDTNPIPDPLPNGYPFDPPSHDQIAQRNLSVLAAGMLTVPQAITVTTIGREEKVATVAVEFSREIDEGTLAKLGLHGFRPAQKPTIEVTLSRTPHCQEWTQHEHKHTLQVHVPRGTSIPVYVSIQARQLPHREYQVIHIVERSHDKLLGGVSYIVVNGHEEKQL